MGRREALLDGVTAEIDKLLDRRLGTIERYLDALGRDIDTQGKQIAFLMQKEGAKLEEAGSDDEPVQQLDVTWQCVKCGHRLGYYSPSDDVLRVRHKDLTLWVSPGPGGQISIVCRSCGELNTISSDEPAPQG